jgi:hypothetical protein
MDRTTIEIKLNRDRAWLIETYQALPPEDLVRGVTRSEHDPSSYWSAKDHLAHLAGIEKNFNRMIRRHFDGAPNPVGLRSNDDGTPRTRDAIMAGVHAMTEAWVQQHRAKPLDAVVALGQQVRADTLALLASLSNEQLAETLPGAPWADGTIGGVLAVNADHGRVHWRWIKDGFAALKAGA